jgi:hypothetical protein
LASLAFGIWPDFPPQLAVAAGALLLVAILWLVPRWAADARFRRIHQFAIIAGAMLGTAAVGYMRFIGDWGVDFYFKIAADVVAVVLMTWLGVALRESMPRTQSTSVS